MRCRAVILTVPESPSLNSLRFRVRCDTVAKGSPCTGQGLEAQEWESRTHLLVIGTEDAEALNGRLPYPGLGDFDAIVQYEIKSMEIQLASIPPHREIKLHFIIAENPYPEPTECSAWYAADIPHRALPAR